MTSRLVLGKLTVAGMMAAVVGALSMPALAYPVVNTYVWWDITAPTSVPGVIEFMGPQGYFASQQRQVQGRANTGLSGPSVWPGSAYSMVIGYSGGSAGGTSAGSMSTLIQGAAGLYVQNLSDSTQAVTLSGQYAYSITESNARNSPPSLDLAPYGVGRGEVGISISVNGTNYFNLDANVHSSDVASLALAFTPWQFTFDLAAHSDALVDAQIFAATKAISLTGSSLPPLLTDSLSPALPLANPVPEPATMALLLLGGLALIRRRGRQDGNDG